ncbi:MAG TPA: TetR/AcrR family transcriptional regulator [Roseiflexaceae bacterium]|nr:TetR/AcrR family transcriptional regulator [Roseiflexaceae bacterium]
MNESFIHYENIHMQPTTDREQRARELQRANILDGARRAFAHKGEAATMADVAEAAGVSQGLAYRYFASKEQIYRELIEQALEQASSAPLAQAQPATPGERLALLITHAVEYRRDHLEIVQLLDQALSADKVPGELAEQIRRHRERFAGELRQLIAEGQASGEVAAGDPDRLILAITATLEGLTRFGLRNPENFARLCPEPDILLRMLMPQRP